MTQLALRLCLVASVLTTVLATAGTSKSYPFQRCFEIASQMHDVPVDLLLAVAATESNWDPAARSHANAHGIMQIQWPGTAHHLGVRRVAELYNPCRNIELGARYLRELIDSMGDETRALASYNYGPSRIGSAATIPDGAMAYVDRVASHRKRIQGNHAQWVIAAGSIELIRFGSRHRATRYAQVLGAKLERAQVAATPQSDGTFVVTLAVGDTGLSTNDSMLLEAIGWAP